MKEIINKKKDKVKFLNIYNLGSNHYYIKKKGNSKSALNYLLYSHIN